jgi:hypothetical protein
MAAKNEQRRDHQETLGDDLLYGADAIAKFLKRKPRWVYHQQKHLGLAHVGATLVGSKARLTKLLTG